MYVQGQSLAKRSQELEGAFSKLVANEQQESKLVDLLQEMRADPNSSRCLEQVGNDGLVYGLALCRFRHLWWLFKGARTAQRTLSGRHDNNVR